MLFLRGRGGSLGGRCEGECSLGEEREGSFVAADARHELLEGGEGGGDRTSCCGGSVPSVGEAVVR